MNLLDLYAKITLDTGAYEKGLVEAEKSGSGFASKLKSGFAAVGKATAVGLGAAATAAGALVTKATEAYASYEQLVGGVETLFGEKYSLEEFAELSGNAVEDIRDRWEELANAPNVVMENAAKAFETAGMSANEYMETVTSFSASLLQGLSGDTHEAAKVADQAIIDMSDNANKMGTSIEMIQNAYQGFAKQNYTMLDNLKLGYGGTQSEMARLINDSGVLGDAIKVNADTVKQISFDKVIEAIHVVQTEMGITGTTAKEAASTIEGSTKAMSAAWQNLLVGMADDNADFDGLIGNLVTSVEAFGSNILPRIEIAMQGVGKLIEGLAPVIAEKLPKLLETVLPSLLTAGAGILTGLAQGIITSLPSLVAHLPQIITTIIDTLLPLLPQLVTVSLEAIATLADGITTNLPVLIPQIVNILLEIIDVLTDPANLSMLIEAAIAIIMGLANGLIESLPALLEKAPEIIQNLVDALVENIPLLLEATYQIVVGLAMGIIQNLPELMKAALQIISAIVNGIGDLMGSIINIGADIVNGIWQGIQQMAGWLWSKVTGFFSGIVDGVKSFLGIHSPSKLFRDEIGKNIGLGVAQGLEDSKDKAVKSANDLAKSVYDKSKKWLDKQVKYQKYSLREQLEVWTVIQGQFIKESQQYADAEEEILDIRHKIMQENLDLEQKYQEKLADRAQRIMDTYGLFDAIETSEAVSGDELLNNLEDQVNSIGSFFEKVDVLAQKSGISEALVKEFQSMGPSAAAELDALLALSEEKLTEYSKLYEEKQKLANRIAAEELTVYREKTETEIQKNLNALEGVFASDAPDIGNTFVAGVATAISQEAYKISEAMTSSANETITKARPLFTTGGKNLGADFAAAIAKELINGTDCVVNAAVRMATKVMEATETTLGIDSYASAVASSYQTYHAAPVFRSANSNGTVVNQYIQAVPMTPAELARLSRDEFDRLRWAY